MLKVLFALVILLICICCSINGTLQDDCNIYGQTTNSSIIDVTFYKDTCYLKINLSMSSYSGITPQCNTAMSKIGAVCGIVNVESPAVVTAMIGAGIFKSNDTFFTSYFRGNCTVDWKNKLPTSDITPYNGTWSLPAQNVGCDNKVTAFTNNNVIATTIAQNTTSFVCQCVKSSFILNSEGAAVSSTTVGATATTIGSMSTATSSVTAIPAMTTTKTVIASSSVPSITTISPLSTATMTTLPSLSTILSGVSTTMAPSATTVLGGSSPPPSATTVVGGSSPPPSGSVAPGVTTLAPTTTTKGARKKNIFSLELVFVISFLSLVIKYYFDDLNR